MGEPIDADLPCATCGYNLRTLSRDGACPECGTSVRDTESTHARALLRYQGLRARGEPWMESVRDALYIGLAAWFGTAFMTVVQSHRPNAAQIVILSLAFVLWFCFGWRLFRPDRNVVNVIGRVAVATVVVGVLASGMNDRWASHYFGKSGPLPWPLGDRFFNAAYAVSQALPYTSVIAIVMVIGRVLSITWLARRRVLGTVATALVAAAALGIVMTFAPYRVGELLRPVRQTLEYALIAAALGMPIWFGLLIWHLTRAIRLGELPAASSRSSPSPRPPG